MHLRPTGGGGDDSQSFYCMYYGSRKTMRLGKRRQVVQRAPHTRVINMHRRVSVSRVRCKRCSTCSSARRLHPTWTNETHPPAPATLTFATQELMGAAIAPCHCQCLTHRPVSTFAHPVCWLLAEKLITFARCSSSWKILSIWPSLCGEAICYFSLIWFASAAE